MHPYAMKVSKIEQIIDIFVRALVALVTQDRGFGFPAGQLIFSHAGEISNFIWQKVFFLNVRK